MDSNIFSLTVYAQFYYYLMLIIVLKVKTFGILFIFAIISQMVRYRANITIVNRWGVRYLPSIDAIVNFVRRDLDLYFQED